MAAFLVDFDGTLAEFGTLRPLPKAFSTLRFFLSQGHQVIVTTARTRLDGIKALLRRNGLEDVSVIGGVQNPRVVINDMGAYAIDHPENAPWDYHAYGDLPVQEID